MVKVGTLTVLVKVDISLVHTTPPKGSGIMPCCGRTPFEVPRTDRMNSNPAYATCGLIKGEK
jgi:hypothetical protein